MEEIITKAMARYGTDMELVRRTEVTSLRGFFHPLSTNSWQGIAGQAQLLGEISQGRYLYMGPGDVEVLEGDMILLGEGHYLVRRSETFYYQNQPIYRWALCVESGVNDTWGTKSLSR